MDEPMPVTERLLQELDRCRAVLFIHGYLRESESKRIRTKLRKARAALAKEPR